MKNAFTLIELIIVVIIIAILAAIAMPIMSNMKARAIAAEAMTGMNAIRTSLQQYYVEHGTNEGLNWHIGNNPPERFPGLSIRTTGNYGDLATDGAPAALDGKYLSQDCYLITISDFANFTLICNTDYNTNPKNEEVVATTDSTFGMIWYFRKKFIQYNWTKTGLEPGAGG